MVKAAKKSSSKKKYGSAKKRTSKTKKKYGSSTKKKYGSSSKSKKYGTVVVHVDKEQVSITDTDASSSDEITKGAPSDASFKKKRVIVKRGKRGLMLGPESVVMEDAEEDDDSTEDTIYPPVTKKKQKRHAHRRFMEMEYEQAMKAINKQKTTSSKTVSHIMFDTGDMCPCKLENGDNAHNMVAKCAVEFLGTFILVHTICMAVNLQSETDTMAPLAIGASLMVIVFAWGHISGGHFNPAVSTGVWVAGKMDAMNWAQYITAQFVGGFVAGCVASQVAKTPDYPAFPAVDVDDIGESEGVWTELLYTFLLVTVVLNTAATKSKGYENNGFFGLAIGFSLFVGVASSGALSGGAFNPAVLIGVNGGRYIYLNKDQYDAFDPVDAESYIYVLLATFGGGILAGAFFLFTESGIPDEIDDGSDEDKDSDDY